MAVILQFSRCTLAKLDKMFQLNQVEASPILQSWLNGQVEITTFEQESLRFYQYGLKQNVHDWNEQELSLHFIGPIFSLVSFTTPKFNLFAERGIEGVIDNTELRGEPDGMIASGKRVPEKPYFCFQEYKKHKEPDGEPEGQCLAAMLVAQELNEAAHPIYGCYVIGHNWYFMVLQGREYAMSEAYVATREDIFDIFRILKVLKQIITELVG